VARYGKCHFLPAYGSNGCLQDMSRGVTWVHGTVWGWVNPRSHRIFCYTDIFAQSFYCPGEVQEKYHCGNKYRFKIIYVTPFKNSDYSPTPDSKYAPQFNLKPFSTYSSVCKKVKLFLLVQQFSSIPKKVSKKVIKSKQKKKFFKCI